MISGVEALKLVLMYHIGPNAQIEQTDYSVTDYKIFLCIPEQK